MTESVRGIIVGTGRAGTLLQYGAFRSAGARIVAFVDLDASRAREAAQRYGVEHSYETLADALASHEVDFVSVCTSSSSHRELAELALTHGSHVLVEKPLTETLEDAQALADAAASAGKVVCVVHNHKFFPGIQQALSLCRSGAVGEIIHLDRQMTFIHSRVRMMEPGHWAHRLPGGRLFEANPHNIYLAYAFIGPMELRHMEARKLSDRWPHAQLDEFTATLSTPRATAQVTMSLNLEPSPEYQRHGPNFIVVTGTKGSLLVDYHRCMFLSQVGKGIGGTTFQRLARKARRLLAVAAQRTSTTRNRQHVDAGSGSGHKYFVERFVGFLEGRYTEPPTSWEEALETQRLNEIMGLKAEAQIRTTTG